MVRYAMGYRSRVRHLRPADSARRRGFDRAAPCSTQSHGDETIGRLYKVLPPSLIAAAMRPSITRHDRGARRRDPRHAAPRAPGAAPAAPGRRAIEPLERAASRVARADRVRERNMCATPRGPTTARVSSRHTH
jgi:hypothetical protein